MRAISSVPGPNLYFMYQYPCSTKLVVYLIVSSEFIILTVVSLIILLFGLEIPSNSEIGVF